MGSHAARERSLPYLFPSEATGAMQTSQELLSKQSLCGIIQSTLYSGSSLVMVLTRRHTGGEGEQDSDRSDRSYTSYRSGTIALGTKVLRGVSNHRKENKVNDDAQETTTEGANRTLSGPEVNTAPQLQNKMYIKKQRNTQCPQRDRAGGPNDVTITHLDPSDAHKGLQKDDRRDANSPSIGCHEFKQHRGDCRPRYHCHIRAYNGPHRSAQHS